MGRPDDGTEDGRIINNLRRTIELTELTLALSASLVSQEDPGCDPMERVMREIRRAKDLAWRKSMKL
jgi:hypothetical protein